jgi:hypothetical protein
MATNWGALAGGIGQGVSAGINIMNQLEEGDFKKEQRDSWRADEAEKKRKRDSLVKYQQGINALNEERKTGTGSFETFLAPSVRENRKNGIAGPGQDRSKAYGSNNPLMNGGEGLYGNQDDADNHFYARLQALQTDYYSVADPAKVPLIGEELAALRDKGYERTRKAATVALLSGAPGAISLANKAYGFQKDGVMLDSNSGSFEKGKGWTGVNLVDANGQVQKTMNFSEADIMRLYLSASPDKLVDFNLNERKVAATESQANSAAVSADASLRNAKSTESLVDGKNALALAQANYYNGAKSNEADARLDTAADKAFAEFGKPLVIDPNLDAASQKRIQGVNDENAGKRGYAVQLYKDPMNKGRNAPGNMWNVATGLHTIATTKLAPGTEFNPGKYFKPVPGKPDYVLYVDPNNPAYQAYMPKTAASLIIEAAVSANKP